jgi:hypothetical protein
VSIGDSYKKNFDTLREAAANGDLCLLEVYDRITGTPHVALCAGYIDEEEMANMIPLAMMFDSNPYDTYVNEPELIAKYHGVVKGPEGHLEHWVEVRAEDGEVTHLDWRSDWNNGPQYTVSSITWGHEVSSSFQCAWSVLYHHLQDVERASDLHMQFFDEVISKLPYEQKWSMAAKELDSWVHHAEHPEEEGGNGQPTAEAAEPSEAP